MEGYKLLFEQDDCAPDSIDVFNKQLSEHVGCNYTTDDLREDALNGGHIDVRKFEHRYFVQNFVLTISADDVYWKLYIKE